MNDETRIDWLSSIAFDVVDAAIDGDNARCKDLLMRVVARYGNGGVYQLSCALAESVAILGGIERDSAGFWGLEVYDLETGVEVGAGNPQVADKAEVKAMQFVMAKVNDDTDMRIALFNADMETGRPVITRGLIRLVAAYGKHRADEHTAGQS